MIHVIAIITAKPGMREAILREFRANVPAVHAENGCIEYGPAIDTPDMGKIQTQFRDKMDSTVGPANEPPTPASPDSADTRGRRRDRDRAACELELPHRITGSVGA